MENYTDNYHFYSYPTNLQFSRGILEFCQLDSKITFKREPFILQKPRWKKCEKMIEIFIKNIQ